VSDPAGADRDKKWLAPAGLFAPAGSAAARDSNDFREVLDALPVAVYITDADGAITYYNEAAARLWGWRPTLGQNRWCGSWKLYWPDGRALPHDLCPMATTLREGRAVRGLEAVAERPDGVRTPFMSYPTLLHDASGAVVGAVNLLVDIADRKRAEERSQQLASIVESSNDAIVSTDLDGIVISWNQGAARLFGYSADEAIGNPIGVLLSPGREDEGPEILDRIRCGEKIDHYETVRRRKDGKPIDISLAISPLRNSEGRIVGASNIARDLGDRRQAEHTAQRLAAIVESSEDAIVAKDLSSIVTHWNRGAERLFGYSADEAMGKPVTILIPPDRQDEEPQILARICRGERIDHYETVRRRKDGTLVEVSLTVSPIRSLDGKVVGASKIARDITERRRALDRQHLLLREMNHRVKNLFTLAGSIVRLSARSASTPQDLAASVGERLEALARAHELTLTNPADAVETSERAATLHALIGAIVSPYENRSGGDESRVAISGVDISLAAGSVSALALLVHEFTTNAAKYGALSTPDGRIEIRCFEEGDRFVLIWKEYGGRPIDGPIGEEGFGTQLTRATAKGQLDGAISRDWAPDGLTIRLSMARARL
jgi:PAS domain S-box-containing protein